MITIYKTIDKLPILCYDFIFKSVFIGNENILAKMISSVTGIDYRILEDNITIYTNEIPIDNKNEKFKKCDFILKIDKDNIINLEINTQSYTGMIIKNLSYVFGLYSKNIKKGQSYNDKFIVTQINIDCFKNDKDALTEYVLRSKDEDDIYTESFKIYTLNVYKCHELYYNYKNKLYIPDYIRWGALIYGKDYEEIDKISKGILTDKERNIIMDKLDGLEKEDYMMTEKEAEEWGNWIKNSIYNDAKKEGIAEGRQEGIEEGKKEGKKEGIEDTIKNMLNNNIDIDLIAKVTNKTEEEILKIKEKM